jgi:hypothetical protein
VGIIVLLQHLLNTKRKALKFITMNVSNYELILSQQCEKSTTITTAPADSNFIGIGRKVRR